ncbi:glucose-6-phosphate isomerase [bacterium]|nr:glucose-6-phosphate isomerase [bacterium]
MMKKTLTLNTNDAHPLINDQKLSALEPRLRAAHQSLLEGTCAGSDFLGWLRWASQDHRQLIRNIREAADKIRAQAQVLVVIGIGGSHLGGQAGLEFVQGVHYNELTSNTKVYFAGHNLSASSWREIIELIGSQDFAINVISKSGTTLEPALAFGFFENILVNRYGRTQADRRICATTDANSGLLHDQAVAHNWMRLVVPDDIGGRYSALTSVGLLPWAVAGIDIEAALAGAQKAQADFLSDLSLNNLTWRYAAARYLLLQAGKNIEALVTYEPRARLFGRWWQQLFGESEGKCERVIFPTTLELTQDLHSLGQYLQQGQKFIFETTLYFDHNPGDELICLDQESSQAWPFLIGKTVDFVQNQARAATQKAHLAGGVPNLQLTISDHSATSLGYLLYFFELSCALSALLLDVNPFDQPGVQAYKTEMMNLLQSSH